MARTAEIYGKVLYELKIAPADVAAMAEALEQTENLATILDHPVLEKETKHRLIEKIFPKSLHNFMKKLSDNRRCRSYQEILEAYKTCVCREKGILQAVLFCVHQPDEQQKKQMENFLMETYEANGVEFQMVYKPDLIGGFVLQVGDREYDWSLKGKLLRLNQRLIRR